MGRWPMCSAGGSPTFRLRGVSREAFLDRAGPNTHARAGRATAEPKKNGGGGGHSHPGMDDMGGMGF